MASSVTLHIAEMKRLRAMLDAAKNARVQVGVWATQSRNPVAHQPQPDRNNPTIGLAMEYGEMRNRFGGRTPPRSFLKVPLQTHLRDKITYIGRSVWRAILLKKGLRLALQELGWRAENVIQEGFATEGWGKWAPLHWKTVARKGSDSILIDSGQLRAAITSKVRMGRPTP
jgi:hypothetical protein